MPDVQLVMCSSDNNRPLRSATAHALTGGRQHISHDTR